MLWHKMSMWRRSKACDAPLDLAKHTEYSLMMHFSLTAGQ